MVHGRGGLLLALSGLTANQAFLLNTLPKHHGEIVLPLKLHSPLQSGKETTTYIWYVGFGCRLVAWLTYCLFSQAFHPHGGVVPHHKPKAEVPPHPI